VIDIEDFSTLLKIGETLKREERWQDAARTFEKALLLYHGDYLEKDLCEE
jgi:hypothetical protein